MLTLEPSLICASPKDFDAQIAYVATCYQIVTEAVLLQLRQNEGLIILPTGMRIKRINVRGQNLSANFACTSALLDRSSQEAAKPPRCTHAGQGSPEDSTKLQHESSYAIALVWTRLRDIF